MIALDSFRAELARHGLDFGGPIITDGKIHRFKAGGDHNRNSWYVLHQGPPVAGAFGCWKRQFDETWCECEPKSMRPEEWKVVRERWAEQKRQAEKEAVNLQLRARAAAARILKTARPASVLNTYLLTKGVKAVAELFESGGKLIVPLRDIDGALHSLQFISPDGGKKFLPGGRVAGCFFSNCSEPSGALALCEGLATGLSIREATALPVVCAMSAGNLRLVAEALSGKYPDREIIIAGDDDSGTAGNPGVTKATEAAKTIGARLAIPRWKDGRTDPADFNDLHRAEGLDTVKTQIEEATAPVETDEETFARLALLPPPDYDRVREAEAERLEIRVVTLDKSVFPLRSKISDNAQGSGVNFPQIEPWPTSIDGAELLRQVASDISRYVYLPDGAANALALWIAHAHCFDAFVISPRLNLRSAEKGCGKTTLLDVLTSLVPRPLKTENMTPAVLFRVIDRYQPVLLLDEVDTYLAENEELRGLLNAGHRRGACAYRVEGDSHEVRGFNAFAPAVLAGIGGLNGQLSTLHDRSVVVDLIRAKPGEVAERFDSRRTVHENELCRKLVRWTIDSVDEIQRSDPTMPGGVFNRMADNWRPLFAIAEVAGGDWPHRASDALAKLKARDDLDAQGIGAVLLADIVAIFDAIPKAEELTSAKIVAELAALEGRPWAEFGKARKPISPNQLANQLRRFGVSSKTITPEPGKSAKGYCLEHFRDPVERFLPDTPFPIRRNDKEAENIGHSDLSNPSEAELGLRIENPISTNKDGMFDGPTDRNRKNGPDALIQDENEVEL